MNRQNRNTSDLPTLNQHDPYRSGPWYSTERNPAEDTWHISVDEFLLSGFASTHRWLAERLEFSAKLSEASERTAPHSQLFVRACSQAWLLSAKPHHSFIYGELRGADTNKIAMDTLLPLLKVIQGMEVQYQPSGLLLTYDDDYQVLHQAAQADKSLYREYCASKGLT